MTNSNSPIQGNQSNIEQSQEVRSSRTSLAQLKAKLADLEERIISESGTLTFSQVGSMTREIKQYRIWVAEEEAHLATLIETV